MALSRVSEFLSVERGLGPEGRIAVVRFDRGDGLNALSPEAMRQLTAMARSFEDDGDSSVVVLTGSAKAFTAGFDLKDAEGRARQDMDLGSMRRALKVGPRVFKRCLELGLITRALPAADTIAFSPPFVVAEAELDEMIAIARQAVDDVAEELR